MIKKPFVKNEVYDKVHQNLCPEIQEHSSFENHNQFKTCSSKLFIPTLH